MVDWQVPNSSAFLVCSPFAILLCNFSYQEMESISHTWRYTDLLIYFAQKNAVKLMVYNFKPRAQDISHPSALPLETVTATGTDPDWLARLYTGIPSSLPKPPEGSQLQDNPTAGSKAWVSQSETSQTQLRLAELSRQPVDSWGKTSCFKANKSAVFKVWSGITWASATPFLGNSHINTAYVITLRHCHLFLIVFQKLHNVCYQNWMNADSDMRTQHFSIEPDIKEISKIR